MRRNQLITLIVVVLVAAGALTFVLWRQWAPVLGVQLQGGVEVVLSPTTEADDEDLESAIEIMRNRVDALGVAEPDITRQGQQVVIQLPGVQDKERAVALVGQTAELRFRPVLDEASGLDSFRVAVERAAFRNGDPPETIPINDEELTFTPPELDLAERSVVLPGEFGIGYGLGPSLMTGEGVADAYATFTTHEWQVNIEFNDQGAVDFDNIAAQLFNNPPPTNQLAIVLDGFVQSAPRLQTASFEGNAVITGNFTPSEAEDLALVLRFGALPVEFTRDDVRTVSATLGEGTLRAGVIAGLVGLALVGIYMIFYYRMLGLVAVASLAISGALLWSLISWLGEGRGLALTLAGTTGIIVSIGVQVDSNIVYYERIREEVRRGRAARSAAIGTFRSAFSTIVWADLASLIGAGVLYQLTTGTVRGFALYLGLATLLDLAVSYFFMRPLVELVASKLVRDKPGRLGVVPDTSEPLAIVRSGAR